MSRRLDGGSLAEVPASPVPERKLILLDADVLGRERTGDETYVTNLLRELPSAAPDLHFAAVTRRPDLVPEGVEALRLPARLQEARMAVSLPRLLRRVRPDLAHFQHALPLGYGGRSVVTVHDLSFEEPDSAMRLVDRLTFRAVVPRAVRRAGHVLAVSERTKRDIVARYGVPGSKVTVTPNGVDPAFSPGPGDRGYVLFVGAIHARKDPEAALDAADAVGLPLVVAGPETDADLARRLRDRGADLRGYVSKDELAELYRGAAALVLPSRFEGFGLPVLEAMASGTPVVAAPEPALQEVADGAAVYAEGGDFGAATRRALEEHDRLAAAGIERARLFSWAETARRTVEAYRQVLA
jgi:glycosyltransferase involved in cell wall biosynthesis